MSALPLILTTAGRDALINAQNTGVSNVVISQIGLAPAQVALSAATTAIPGETKRLNLVGGTVVAPETFYVSGTDTSADTYTVRTVALYLSNGVLLGGYSQAAVLLEKAEPAMAVIEASIRLAEPLATSIEFTGGGWNNPPASESTEGVIRLATQLEVNAGTNDKRAVTPKTLKALLDAVLAGFSPSGHTHDASATTTGTFTEARIPDLGMGRITGLIAALAGKAAAAHTHAMSEVNGLVDALAGKAAAAHTHAMSEVNGLVAALAGKAASAHSHVMADIAGLVAALALKADLAGAIFTGSIAVRSSDGVGFLRLYSGDSQKTGYINFFAPGGTDIGYIGYDQNPYISVNAYAGRRYAFNTRPLFEGFTPWDSGNFDPSSKAGLVGPSFTGSITVNGPAGSYREVMFRTANALRWDIFADTAPENGGNAGSNLTIARYADNANYLGSPITISRSSGQVTFETRPTWAAGATPWDSGNFNPADKANALHSHDWAQITGAPSYDRTTTTAALRILDATSTVRGFMYATPDSVGFLTTTGADWQMRLTAGAAIFAATTLTIGGEVAWHDGNARSSSANFRANADHRALTPNTVWAAAGFVALAQAATIAVDLAAGLNFSTTMTGNRTLGAPANAKPGQSGVIYIQQDGTGGRTLAFDANWKFAGGTDPVLSTTANAVDILAFTVIAPAMVVGSLIKDVR